MVSANVAEKNGVEFLKRVLKDEEYDLSNLRSDIKQKTRYSYTTSHEVIVPGSASVYNGYGIFLSFLLSLML